MGIYCTEKTFEGNIIAKGGIKKSKTVTRNFTPTCNQKLPKTLS